MATLKKEKIPDLLPPFQRKKQEDGPKTKPDEKWGYTVTMPKGSKGETASRIEITPGSDDKTVYENEKLRGIQDEVKVSKCLNTDVVVKRKCNIIKLIKCENCTLAVNGAISGIDVNNCKNININIGQQEADKVEVSGSENVKIDCREYGDISTVQLINENSSATVAQVKLADGSVADIPLPDKFLHSLVVKQDKDDKEVAIVESQPTEALPVKKATETVASQKGTPRKGAQQKQQLVMKEVSGDDVLVTGCEIAYIPVTAEKSLTVQNCDDIKIKLLGNVTDIVLENSKNVNIDCTDIADLKVLSVYSSQTAHASVTYKLDSTSDFAHDLELPNQFVHWVNSKEGKVSCEVAMH